jgi:hypothetical protein
VCIVFKWKEGVLFSGTSPKNTTKYPSVTQVFGHYLADVPQKLLEYAGDRGTRVHRFCTSYAINAFMPGGVDDDCKGYFLSFQEWFHGHVKQVLWVEKEFVDHDFGFAGHPDLGLELKDGRRTIVDLKTPRKFERVWAGQLAAYRHLAEKNGEKFDPVGSLRLNPYGGPAIMKWYQDSPRDLAAFVNLLTGYKYFFGN